MTSHSFWHALERAQRGILIVCNLAVMSIVCASVVMRYALEMDFYGAEEILMIFAHWLYFIGASQGSHERSHVEADFIRTWLGDRGMTRALGLLRDVIEIGVLFVLTYWSVLFIGFALERWPVSPGWRIPLIIPESAILVGFLLMTMHALRHFWFRLRGDAVASAGGG